MRKRASIVLLLLALLVAAAWLRWVPEPSYQGVPLGSLLDGNAASGGLRQAQDAVRALGAKAVPYLVNVLEREPTMLQRWYAKAQPKLPAALQQFAPRPRNFNQRRAWAAAVLSQAGTNAVVALPVLISTAHNDAFFGTRHNAVGALAALAPGTPFEQAAAVAVLCRTTDPNKALCEHAYRCLGAFTNQLRVVVPSLVQSLNDPQERDSALLALKRFGTRMRYRLPGQAEQNGGKLFMSFEALSNELAPLK